LNDYLKSIQIILAMNTDLEVLEELTQSEYKYGFTTDLEVDEAPFGLNEGIVRFISAKKNEPEWMLNWRLTAYKKWLEMKAPHWANVTYPEIDYQAIKYYSAPKPKKTLNSLDEVDPEIRATFEKLGISLDEQKRLTGVAVDAVLDSVSIATTFKEKLAKDKKIQRVIFHGFGMRWLSGLDGCRCALESARGRYCHGVDQGRQQVCGLNRHSGR
jgi:hypothetical protein